MSLLRLVLLVAAVVLGLTPAAGPVAAGILEAHCPVAMAEAAAAEHRDHAGASHGADHVPASHVPADCCLGGLAVLAPFADGLPPRDRPAPPRGLTEVDQLVGLSHAPASPPPETKVRALAAPTPAPATTDPFVSRTS